MSADLKPDPVVKIPKGMIFPIRARGSIQLPVVTLDGESYTLHIGAVSPLGGSPDMLSTALCFRHERLILKILYGRRFDAPEVPIRYLDLLDTNAAGVKQDGHKQRMLLRRTLTELGNTWIHRVKGGKVDAMRLLEYNPEIFYKDGVDLNDAAAREDEGNIRYRLLRSVKFNEDFWRAFLVWSQCWVVRADVVNSLRSDIAAACYLSLVPKAYNPAIKRPARKDAAELLREIGAVVPERRFELRRVFERRRGDQPSILESLNGAATWKDRLGVETELEENAQGTGFNILYWIDETAVVGDEQRRLQLNGAIYNYWIDQGLASEELDKCRHPEWRKIEAYERERIEDLGYPVEKNRAYLELVRSIIGPIEFGVVIGAAHLARREERTKIDDMERWFGASLRNAFREFTQAYAGRSHRKRASR